MCCHIAYGCMNPGKALMSENCVLPVQILLIVPENPLPSVHCRALLDTVRFCSNNVLKIPIVFSNDVACSNCGVMPGLVCSLLKRVSFPPQSMTRSRKERSSPYETATSTTARPSNSCAQSLGWPFRDWYASCSTSNLALARFSFSRSVSWFSSGIDPYTRMPSRARCI